MYTDLQKKSRAYEITAQPFKHVDKKRKTEGVFRCFFSDGYYKEYSIKELKKIDFFSPIFKGFSESQKQEVRLQYIRSDVFEVVIGLILRDQHISELLRDKEELKLQPNLYEIVEEALDFLHPGKTEEILNDLKEHQLRHITYEKAKQLGENDANFVCVKIAKEILLFRNYFETDQDTQLWTKKKKLIDRELWIVGKKLQASKEQYWQDLTDFEKTILLSHINSLDLFKKKLKEQMKDSRLTEQLLPMKCHLRASQNVGSDDPLTKKQAENSQMILNNYRQEILLALKESGADIERKDLLEHLIGPKNFLFDEYGLKAQILENPLTEHFAFVHPKVPRLRAGYSLDNLSPYELEKEIRKDLKHYNFGSLPPRVIKSPIKTRPVTDKVKELRDFFMDKLVHWKSLDDPVKKEVIGKLIELSGWQEINITADDIQILELTFKTTDEITGIMSIRGREVEFFFNTYDFIICYMKPNGDRYNQYSTLQTLRNFNLLPLIDFLYRFY